MATTPSGMAAQPRQSYRVGRIILLVGLSVIGLVVMTLVLLPYVIALDPIKERLVTQIETALQRQVDIGAIRLQILSGLGAGIEEVTVHNPPGWHYPHMLKVDTLSVKVAWRPLLQRRLEVTKVILRGGEIVIERDAQGRLNIAAPSPVDPAAMTVPPALPPPASPSPQTPPEDHAAAGLLVSEVTLRNVTVTFVDQKVAPGQALTTTVRDVQVDLRDVARGAPIPFDMAATALTDQPRNLRARGHVGPLPVNATGEGLPIEVHMQASDLLVHQLTPYLGAASPVTQGRVGVDVKVQGYVGGSLDVQGSLSLAEAMFRDLVGGGPPTPLPQLTTTYGLTFDMADERLQLKEALVKLADIQATMTGVVHHLMSTPQFDLRLTTNNFAPGELLSDFPMVAATLPPRTELRGRAQLQAALKGQPQDAHAAAQVDLQELALHSGRFTGGPPADGGIRLETDSTQALVTLRATQPRPPHVHIEVHAQSLLFEQHTAKPAGAASVPAPAPRPTEPPPPPPAPQPPFTLDGQVRIDAGQIQGVDVQQLTAAVSLVDGVLTSQHQVKVYGGSYQGDIQANLAQQEPPYTLNAKVLDLDVGRALNALTPIHNAMFGVLNSDLHLSGQGFTWELIRQTLTGDGALRISAAKLTTFDLMPKLVQVLRGVGGVVGMSLPAEWERLAFDTIEGSLRLRQGKIFTEALKLRGTGVEAILKGYVALDQSLDYTGTVFLPGKLGGERGPLTVLRRDDKGRLMWPFAVRGTLQTPQIAFDEGYLREVAQEALIDKVKKQLGGTAGGGQAQPSGQTGGEAGTPPPRDLPRKILEDLFRR